MNRHRSIFCATALAVPCLLLLLSVPSFLAQAPAAAEPEFTGEVTPEPVEVVFGSGPFNLLHPTQGLGNLSSYRASLTLSFDGVNDGKPDQWSRTYVMLVGDTPAARQLTIETAGDPAASIFMLEMNNASFERRGTDACTASALEPGNPLAEAWEPASFLFSVIGADEAGTETANGVAADHFTFDEQALGARDVADATGEIWVAAGGGYLVRYLLEIAGGGGYFGPTIEGTLRLDYELSEINQPLSVEAPADCPRGLLDIPLLPDATDVVRQPSMTTYTTHASPADAAAFYEEQLAGTFGEPSMPPSVSESTALLEFTQGDTLTSVIASAGDGVTTVMVIAGSNTPPADTEGSETAESITVQVESGGTVEIPLLPDAIDVASMEGIATYFSATEAADAASFYQDRLLELGGQIYTPLNTFGGVSVMEIVLGDYLLAINIRAEGDGGSSLFIRVDPPGTFTPIAAPLPAPTQGVNVPNPLVGDCAAGSGGIPILPDATDRVEAPGMISYSTTTRVTDAAAFYTEQLEAVGGQVFSAMPVSDAMAMLQFTLDGQAGSVMIMATGGVNSVVISAVSGVFGPPPADCDAPATAAAPAGTPPTVSPDDCSVSAATAANQRSGPGTNYALVGSLASGTRAPVLGQATGADGFVWWQLDEGVWVRSDVVSQSGHCDDVPTVQPS